MVLTLERHPPGFTCTIGELLSDGQSVTHTLEDLPHAEKIDGQTCIPAGRYRVILSESQRAKDGSLWTPDKWGRLPLLLSVPGFEGIRIHAGNTDKDTRGCILVGQWRGGEFVSNSRPALQAVIDLIEIAQIARRSIFIDVKDAA